MIVSERKHITLIELGYHLSVCLAMFAGTVTDKHSGPVTNYSINEINQDLITTFCINIATILRY